MEVVAATHSPGGTGPPGGPFQTHDVQEWQHLNRLTGVLETARRESGSWKSDQQQYGKVVDSCSLVSADGSSAQRQLRQLEVFQSRSPGTSLQVIRAHTHTSSSSSSNRWTSAGAIAGTGEEFENLQLALNPLDLSSQKTKASVGRSGSLGGRRPPSRPRSLTSDLEVTARLQKVSRLCQQLHEDALALNPNEDLPKRTGDLSLQQETSYERFKKFDRPSILERQNGDGSVSSEHFDSSEPIRNGRVSPPKIEDWRSSYSKIKSSDLDTGRRLNTALRGNNVDLEALDQILKSISSSTTSSSFSDKLSDDLKEEPEKDSSKLKKRHSFITAESLQEVRGRLRRLSSPVDEFHQKINLPAKEEEPDDGIVAEDSPTMKKEDSMPASNNSVSRVRSYVYGMEAMLHNKKPIIGTGSLESRSSNKSNGGSVNRSEDWYNRRKSYGFEQVHNQQIDNSNSISLRGKNKIESSTDSGICRSTEIVVIPSVFKSQIEENNKYGKVTSYSNSNRNSTVINLGGEHSKNTSNIIDYPTSNNIKDNELFNVWNRRSIVSQEDFKKKDVEQITITIPIVSDESSQNGRRLYHRQISDGTSVSVENNIYSPEIKRHSIAVDESKYVHDNKFYPQLRRTSLAMESSKPEEIFEQFDEEGCNNLGKKQKKVEFCKTEVHFAAESGRVNIVETDEKPPPTQNFRRRRRNSNITSNHVPEEFNKNGLPLIHFGDTSYEKKLFGVSDAEIPQNDVSETYNKDVKSFSAPVPPETVYNSNVTVSAVSVSTNKDFEDLKEIHETENPPRGILKNRMIKPRPYILGDDNNELLTQNEDPESSIWGVRLRPVHREDSAQIWRSTVTVQNTSYNNSSTEPVTPNFEEPPKPEFQKLLHSLRPARKSEPSITPPESTIERSSPILDLRRSSWSVADRVKQVEDMKQTEIKGYSTRINFGGGEATVIENGDLKKEERHQSWPRQEEAYLKDFPSSKSSLQPLQKKPDPLIPRFEKSSSSEAKITSVSLRSNERRSSNNSSLESPQLERKQLNNVKKSFDISRNSFSNGHLSSPSLVGSSIQKNTQRKLESVIQKEETKISSERSAFNKVTSSKDSPSLRRKNPPRKTLTNTYTKTVKNNFYNEISSPNSTKKLTDKPRNHSNQWKENKPDLLQFNDNREYVNLTTVIKEENKSKKASSAKKSIEARPESPIYENIDDVITNLQQMEKESTMLQELTKAADQILQAVNGYTDEDSKLSTDSEDETKKHRLNLKKTAENLCTISETKSWKQKTQTKLSSNVKNPKNKVRPTSSTSSIESITKESKPVPPVRMNRATKLNEAKKKITGSNSELSKATRARRLQRASSREALLQSHGSSSEDITTNIEIIRKPRLVRRTKTQNSTTEELKKSTTQNSTTRRTQSDTRKNVERVPEIRHKTAISTIKSTAEKNASREKALKGKEDSKKKITAKTASNLRGLTSHSYSRPTREAPGVLGGPRTSSLTMKKFNKSESITKY